MGGKQRRGPDRGDLRCGPGDGNGDGRSGFGGRSAGVQRPDRRLADRGGRRGLSTGGSGRDRYPGRGALGGPKVRAQHQGLQLQHRSDRSVSGAGRRHRQCHLRSLFVHGFFFPHQLLGTRSRGAGDRRQRSGQSTDDGCAERTCDGGRHLGVVEGQQGTWTPGGHGGGHPRGCRLHLGVRHRHRLRAPAAAQRRRRVPAVDADTDHHPRGRLLA